MWVRHVTYLRPLVMQRYGLIGVDGLRWPNMLQDQGYSWEPYFVIGNNWLWVMVMT
ncbi:hypothetical protein CDL12_16243 [Handroanthus impetiginosus]|uniref:Uncharacterized protein n=1 Tax=Handroanthus impetiginosus TaxID=429701 RepID=A0A2G9H0X2_9LAMI|nr:hypothetical protein CDL12_16243 [Handroanthus impetiginosus]